MVRVAHRARLVVVSFLILWIYFLTAYCQPFCPYVFQCGDTEIMAQEKKKEQHVIKKVLDNGMTVLVYPMHDNPKVAIDMFYHVGSKDEKEGEKGIAHLIEHMIFKGTEKLSESDIDVVVHKLSGSSNAFTTPDYTGYKFVMPTHHWKKILPIIADCMNNVAFKDEHLNSEMKAVIQELKMIKDQFIRYLTYELMGLMFAGHPYHYPLIGYKRDLWSVQGKDLRAFYKKHYVPNNATLVVVGDVDPQDVFNVVQKEFGSIPSLKGYTKEQFYLHNDIVARSLTVYRDVQLPLVLEAFRIPGANKKMEHVIDILEFALGNGKGARLHKKLVDELQLVTQLGAASFKMFDSGMFFLYFEPKSIDDLDTIESIIFEEMKDVAMNGLTHDELVRATKQIKMKHYIKKEKIEDLAFDIGRTFLATGDSEYAFNYFDISQEQAQQDVQQFVGDFFRSSVLHRGVILPLPEQEKEKWQQLQIVADQLDNKILSARIRTAPVEGARYANTVSIEEPVVFEFPKAQKFQLSNGVEVLYSNNINSPKIDIVLSLKAKDFYDLEMNQGIYRFVTAMLSEGTKNYTAQELTEAIESRGMRFHADPGVITMSMLSVDLEKGLELLQEMISRATFEKKRIEKVRSQLLAQVSMFWDNPMSFSNQLIKEHLYAGHPFGKNTLGTKESISSITRKDLKSFYKNYFSPDGARIALVGDLSGYDLPKLLEKTCGCWTGPQVENIEFPPLKDIKKEALDHYIDRDQVVLCFAGLSVDRNHEDYEKLWLFDQIFGGGDRHSGVSRLKMLREQSGLFYTATGALTAGSREQPGIAFVKALVSLDRLDEAQTEIEKVINQAIETVNPREFLEARLALINSLIDRFESNLATAISFLFLERFGLSADYFDKQAQILSGIRIEDMQEAVRKILNSEKMITLRVGRVGQKVASA